MKAIPGTLQDGGAPFGTTHWSVVLASAQSQGPQSADALARLCQSYWPPLYSFVRRRGYGPHDAQDLTQGFFAYLLANKSFARTDPADGKFRSFLLASLKHYLADAWDSGQTLKRGGGRQFVTFDEAVAEALYQPEAAAGMSAERLFELRWARALVEQALARLQAELLASGKESLYNILKPFLTGGSAVPSYEAAAEALQLPVTSVRNHIHRLRGHYRTLLRRELARTVSRPEEIDDELRHLCEVLAAGGGEF